MDVKSLACSGNKSNKRKNWSGAELQTKLLFFEKKLG